MIQNCKEEVLVILPPEKDIVRNDDFLQKLERTQVRIRILSPEEDERKFSSQLGIEWRRIVPINLGVAIYDKSKMLITQNENPSEVTNRSSLQSCFAYFYHKQADHSWGCKNLSGAME